MWQHQGARDELANENIINSADDDMDNYEPHINTPPCTYNNTPLSHKSLMASHRCLEEHHMIT
jgi:hypothetical protein